MIQKLYIKRFIHKTIWKREKTLSMNSKKTVNIPSFGFDETRFIHGLSNVLWYRICSFFESESYYLVLEFFKGE